MTEKRNTDIMKISLSAVFATALVLLVWIYKQPRFQSISGFLLIAAIIAFTSELFLLILLKGKNKLKRAVKIVLLFFINISVFTSGVIYSFAPAVILQPHRDEASEKELKGVSFAEEISIEGENGEISGWFYDVAGERAPTVLYFYGNYETAATRLLQLTKNYAGSAFNGCNFAVFDYPSYGKSEGKCTDDSILAFSLDVYDELIKRTDSIIVLGYSVGTGPACYLAGKRDVKALILYAPYADGADLYNNVLNIFHGPLERLVAFDIDNKENVRSVTAPSLILASENDELIPYESSMELIDKFNYSCSYIKVPDITHNQFLSSSFVRDETEVFIKEVLADES